VCDLLEALEQHGARDAADARARVECDALGLEG